MEAVDPDLPAAENRERAKRHLHGNQEDESGNRCHQPACPAVVIPDVSRCRQNRQRDDQRAHAVRKVHRNACVPVVRDDPAEHQREIGNGQPGAGMPHRGADR